MTVTLVLSIHLLVGLIVVELCLRYDSDDQDENIGLLQKHAPLAYGCVMLFGALLWPLAIHNAISRVRKRRRSSGYRFKGAMPGVSGIPEGAEGRAEPVRVVCGRCGEKAVTFFLSPESGSGKRCSKCGHEEEVADLPAAYAQAASQPDVSDFSLGEFICPLKCPSCEGPAKLYGADQRTRGWYRVTCQKGHWGDLRSDSILIPEEHRVPWKEGA